MGGNVKHVTNKMNKMFKKKQQHRNNSTASGRYIVMFLIGGTAAAVAAAAAAFHPAMAYIHRLNRPILCKCFSSYVFKNAGLKIQTTFTDTYKTIKPSILIPFTN